MPDLDSFQNYADRLDIRKLRADYAHLIDAGEWEAYGDLFTEDAVVEYSMGTIEGREAIVQNARDNINYEYSMHTAQMPRLTIDGDEASGEWYTLVYARNTEGSEGWIFGRYEDEYRRVDGEWKFSRLASLMDHHTGGLLNG